MNSKDMFYMCPVCFQVCDSDKECHAHRMVSCRPGPPGDARRKPVEDRFGKLVSRAPRWYLEAVGTIQGPQQR
jgi:hypothetical protein